MQTADLLFLAELEAQEEVHRASQDICFFLDHVKCVDEKTGEVFEFQLLDPEQGWHWQRAELDAIEQNDKTIFLKGRQLGMTWLAGGKGLHTMLYTPGSSVLSYSINELEASKLVNRVWDMFWSLPEHLRNGVEVLKPSRGARPYTEIVLRHRDGKISSLTGMASTKSAGHGRTAAVVILDEFSRQEYARETWKAVIPTMADGGKVIVISTANGTSNELTGEGNFFHHLWVNSEEYGLESRFLRWNLHPDRDDDWYANVSLKPEDRAEQYPDNPHEAFLLSGRPYFDKAGLAWYAQHGTKEPLYRMDFVLHSPRAARRVVGDGRIVVYQEPVEGGKYALAADVATGRGLDYSVAAVINLQTMAPCAELHAKIDQDEFAAQIHFLGRWYNTAVIAVEVGGGYGEAVIVPLRDGREGRPAYPKLYRHVLSSRSDLPIAKPFGFPMNTKTRPLVLSQTEAAIREHALPYMPAGLLSEAQTFVHAKTNPSPRAQDGCNDDRVMAWSIALEMYRLYGSHPERKTHRKRSTRRPLPSRPWSK